MKVTSTRVRILQNNRVFAIASVTLDEQLIINDIMVYDIEGNLVIKMPNSEHSKSNQQYSLVAQKELFGKIKTAIMRKIFSQLHSQYE